MNLQTNISYFLPSFCLGITKNKNCPFPWSLANWMGVAWYKLQRYHPISSFLDNPHACCYVGHSESLPEHMITSSETSKDGLIDLPTLPFWPHISSKYYWYLKKITHDNPVISHTSDNILKFSRFQFKPYWMVVLLRQNSISYGSKNIGTWLYIISDAVLNIISFVSPKGLGKSASSTFIYEESKAQRLGQPHRESK